MKLKLFLLKFLNLLCVYHTYLRSFDKDNVKFAATAICDFVRVFFVNDQIYHFNILIMGSYKGHIPDVVDELTKSCLDNNKLIQRIICKDSQNVVACLRVHLI
jgi:hypothetical protein